MIARSFQFPQEIETHLRRILELRGIQLDACQSYAKKVLELSDLFTSHDGTKTPWDNWAAYMLYFFPLNMVRAQAVLQESFRDFPWGSVQQIVDFGSGPGTVHAALEVSDLEPKPILCVETDARAVKLHQDLGLRRFPCKWSDRLPRPIQPGTLGIFSYSLLEEPAITNRLAEFEHLLIVSPSTRQQGRLLLETRAALSTKGFSSWAPCTHQQACPLLSQSKTDWCHDRIHFDSPEWYRSLEAKLPMQNTSLTFSYWFASRTQPAPEHRNRARVTGDTLYEKGKVRQLVCRGPEREFLAWLSRDGEAPQIPRGSLIELSPEVEKKSNELRGYRHPAR